ncbi:MAG: MerR family transcriptional regulator [Hyphomicrobiaceae bacterium]|nr:MerR family transcriptional regulator [Hyphomicrobiaceae bacterium]
MRIGELAGATGLSRDTIRFYERHGLVASRPSPEPSNDYRDYPEELVERLDMILAAREAGLSIADLSTLFSHLESETAGDGGFDADRFIDDKIVELRKTIRQARKVLDLLMRTRQALDRGPAGGE